MLAVCFALAHRAVACLSGMTKKRRPQGWSPREPLILRGASARFVNSQASEQVLSGPAGCVAPETRIYLPLTDEHVAIADLHKNKIAPVVLTTGGPARAEVPFVKGTARLHLFRFVSGKSCVVTDDHRFFSLVTEEWVFARDCEPDDVLLGRTGDVLSPEIVLSVRFVRTGEYFDITVPGEEHYLAEGLFHHNTGKSITCLLKLHMACEWVAGIRCLMVRKTRESLTESALVSYETKVLPEGHAAAKTGGARKLRQSYRYPNGSEIIVGGMDKPSKVLSTEYDLIWCFVGETRVESPSPIHKVFRREYSGPLITLRTAAGHELTGSPNHPVLTDRGWVAMGLLRKGDDVVSRRFGQDGGVTDPDVDHQPPTIAEVARSFAEAGGGPAATQRVPLVGMDFHGDGSDGHVDVISAGGDFGVGTEAAVAQPAGELFVGRTRLDLIALERDGAVDQELLRLRGAGRDGHAFEAGAVKVVGVPVVADLLRFAGGEVAESSAAQGGLEGGFADADRLSDRLERSGLIDKVALDRVVHVFRADVVPGDVRHIYNLQTGDGYYIANGVVVHNCQESTELKEDDWQTLITRLRNNKLSYQQILADCNPESPTHWLKRRSFMEGQTPGDGQKTLMFESRHEDNPSLYDDVRKCYTESGARYIARLDALGGAMLQRMRYGKWVQAEGVVYPEFDTQKHILTTKDMPEGCATATGGVIYPPPDWPRYWAVDFGYTSPFSLLMCATDHDRRLYVYREIYHTGLLVEDHGDRAKKMWDMEAEYWSYRRKSPLNLVKKQIAPRAIVCDSADPEGRATLERCLGVSTTGAMKQDKAGIQLVSERLREAGDGRPRLFLFANCLDLRDQSLADRKQPCSLAEEFGCYRWNPDKDTPIKEFDHSADAIRYLIIHLDKGVNGIYEAPTFVRSGAAGSSVSEGVAVEHQAGRGPVSSALSPQPRLRYGADQRSERVNRLFGRR